MTRSRRTLDVLAFGEVLWDIFELDARTLARVVGGAPANVAVQLARLGLRAGVLGAVGDDFLGDDLRRALVREGVESRFLLTKAERTGVVFIRRDRSGEPHFLFYRENSADMAVTETDVRKLCSQGGARWLHLSTSTLSRPNLRAATLSLAKGAKRSAVAVDLNVRARLWPNVRTMREATSELVSRAHLVKASASDLRALGFNDEARGLRWLRRQAPNAVMLLTRGGGAATAYLKRASVSVPARRRRVVDSTGAGDAFLSGVLAVLVRAGVAPGDASFESVSNWRSAMEFGHLVAREVVGAVGSLTGTEDIRGLKRRLQAFG